MRFKTTIVALLLCAVVTTAQNRSESAVRPKPDPRRAQFLDMFARAYFPGRTGQILIVPREGDIITLNDPDVPYMHGSPWGYDVEIPILFAGDGHGTPVAGSQPNGATSACGAADRARRDAPRLLRSLRRRDAGALETTPRGRLVHPGAGQLPSVE